MPNFDTCGSCQYGMHNGDGSMRCALLDTDSMQLKPDSMCVVIRLGNSRILDLAGDQYRSAERRYAEAKAILDQGDVLKALINRSIAPNLSRLPALGKGQAKLNMPVLVRDLMGTRGLSLNERYTNARRLGARGKIVRTVLGYEEEVYEVRHEDGALAMYRCEELCPAGDWNPPSSPM